MKILTAKFNEDSGCATIKFNYYFNFETDWLYKADAIQDLIGILNREYENLMSIEDWDKRNKYILRGK